jgi:hypothetical protein
MRRRFTGDVWTDAKLLEAEERMAAAHRVAARRALLRGRRSLRRGVRVWVGAVLLAAGWRLLGSLASPEPGAQGSAGSARSGRNRSACPLCRSPVLAASSGPRPR